MQYFSNGTAWILFHIFLKKYMFDAFRAAMVLQTVCNRPHRLGELSSCSPSSHRQHAKGSRKKTVFLLSGWPLGFIPPPLGQGVVLFRRDSNF